METYIKYKRIEKTIINNESDIQNLLDDLIINGWEIIYYNENERIDENEITGVKYLDLKIIVGKKQNNVL